MKQVCCEDYNEYRLLCWERSQLSKNMMFDVETQVIDDNIKAVEQAVDLINEILQVLHEFEFQMLVSKATLGTLLAFQFEEYESVLLTLTKYNAVKNNDLINKATFELLIGETNDINVDVFIELTSLSEIVNNGY